MDLEIKFDSGRFLWARYNDFGGEIGYQTTFDRFCLDLDTTFTFLYYRLV